MEQTIYLVVSRHSVERMTKNLPNVGRGEIPVKLDVTVDPGAFGTPVLERSVHVEDWRQGIDLADVEFRSDIITEAEAEIIRERRLAQMRKVLEGQGYTVSGPDDGEAGAEL